MKKIFLIESKILSESQILADKIKQMPFYQEVKENGGKIYVVGGAVRDELTGKDAKDLDLMIRGIEMDRLAAILKKYGTVKFNEVGGKQAIIIFHSPEIGEDIEIALPRTEQKNAVGGYHGFDVNIDHNLPIDVDLGRRDLGINAMAVGDDGILIDPYGGKQDIENKVVRATSERAFIEDPLRMLRAIQFASRFEYEIEPNTFKLIQNNAHRIKEITKERYLIEFDKILRKGNAYVAMNLLVKTGLFEQMFDFSSSSVNPVEFDGIKNLGDFFFLIIKNNLSENEISKFKANFKLTNEDFDRIAALYKLKNLVPNKNAHNLYTLFLAMRKDKDVLQSALVPKKLKQLSLLYPMSISELEINGQDLINLKVPEKLRGQLFIRILQEIYKGELKNDRDQLINFVKTTKL